MIPFRSMSVGASWVRPPQNIPTAKATWSRTATIISRAGKLRVRTLILYLRPANTPARIALPSFQSSGWLPELWLWRSVLPLFCWIRALL